MERRTRLIAALLAANALISWIILPLAIPPYRGYSLAQLLEVLFWQGVGTVGWPFAILGGFLALLFGRGAPSWPLLLTFLYPAMLFLLLRVMTTRQRRRVELFLLHLLVPVSFALIWHSVLNGFDFMVG